MTIEFHLNVLFIAVQQENDNYRSATDVKKKFAVIVNPDDTADAIVLNDQLIKMHHLVELFVFNLLSILLRRCRFCGQKNNFTCLVIHNHYYIIEP
jgi:hypothetical protein